MSQLISAAVRRYAASVRAPAGASLVGAKLAAAGAGDRTQEQKNADYKTVLDFWQPGDIDDTEAIERSIAALGAVRLVRKLTPYVIRRTIRATSAVQFTADEGVLVSCAAGFAGIVVTKGANPAFVLKAAVAVFIGNTIDSHAGGRIGETGLSARVDWEIDCAGNADVGIYAERCPGIRIESSVKNCVDGIFLGPFCWGAQIIHPKVLSFTGKGLELGFGSNGSRVEVPEIWGYLVEGAVGVVCRGNNNGFTISGGYIEGVVDGFLATEETGAVEISGVDFEVISGHAIRAVQVGAETRSDGPITVRGCYLDSVKEEIHTTGARVISKGNRYRDPYAATGSHFFSANEKSIILSEGDSWDTASGAAIPMAHAGTKSLTAEVVGGRAVVITNKKATDPSGADSVHWALLNYASDSQPEVISSSLTFSNSRQGGPTAVYSARSEWSVNETETGPGPVNIIKYSAGVVLSVLGGLFRFAPKSDNSHQLGAPSFRWKEVHAGAAAIITSDERHKQDAGEIPDAWLDAWAQVKWQRFKFVAAVTLKGDAARWHVGLLAQQIERAFAAAGLNAFEIGVLCRDEVEGGYIYGVRYEEALSLEAALLRRELARLAR